MAEETLREPEVALCTSCAAPVPAGEHFCRRCGCPASFAAMSMPYETILSEGFAYREGSAKPRRLIVVLGIWVIFAPTFVFLTYGFFAMLLSSQGIAREDNALQNAVEVFCGLGLTGGGAAISGFLIYKTTRNYLKLRRASPEPNDEENDEENDTDESANMQNE